jgi:hypothetical protein
VHADFRDEYYAVRGHVAEGEQGPGRARIITSGSLDCGRVQWGVRRARIHGQDWLRPVAPIAALHPRQRDRLGPCVLVATQTRVIEAAAVPEGDAVGLTPVLTVIPKDSGGSWTIDALLGALLSPAATAWALRQCRGSGLTLDSIKLSATQLRALPLPPSPSHPEEFGLDGATRAALESWFARRRSR